jgi:RimJ/RimL family protein N-acetyltransferase
MSESEPPILNITGEKVALGPRRRELLPLYLKWINDFESLRTLGGRLHPMTMEAEEQWYADSSRNEPYNFTIYERSTLRPIGNTGFHEVNLAHRQATFGILIGEKECWNQGYGTEATRLMLDYGFNALGLHNIMLHVFSNNPRAVRAYQKAGFREMGRRREARRVGDRVYDVIYMDCLATEFQSPVLRKLLQLDDE